MEKRDGNVTNIFFPKPSLITVFDEKNIAQNNSYIVYTIIIVYSFYDFIIKPKWNSSILSENRRNWKFDILPSLLLVRTRNSIYKNYSFEA